MEALRGDDLDGRHAGDRLGDFARGDHGSQHAAALGDEEIAVRQERERPRTRELVGDDVDFVARFALRWRRLGLAAERRLRLARLRGGDAGCKEQKRREAARAHCRPPLANFA